jgi:hypothetical protein
MQMSLYGIVVNSYGKKQTRCIDAATNQLAHLDFGVVAWPRVS